VVKISGQGILGSVAENVNSWNVMYPRDMACLSYAIIANTTRKRDNE
jgi:hypothetical protein